MTDPRPQVSNEQAFAKAQEVLQVLDDFPDPDKVLALVRALYEPKNPPFTMGESARALQENLKTLGKS